MDSSITAAPLSLPHARLSTRAKYSTLAYKVHLASSLSPLLIRAIWKSDTNTLRSGGKVERQLKDPQLALSHKLGRDLTMAYAQPVTWMDSRQTHVRRYAAGIFTAILLYSRLCFCNRYLIGDMGEYLPKHGWQRRSPQSGEVYPVGTVLGEIL